MLKTQRFASLFRHYAKHHGLDKETLVFFFTEELQNDDTPESVHMQVRITTPLRLSSSWHRSEVWLNPSCFVELSRSPPPSCTEK
jgi:hypothetical protein